MRFLACVSAMVMLVAFVGCEQKQPPPKKPEAKSFVIITNHAAQEVTAAATSMKAKLDGTSITVSEGTTAEQQVAALKQAESSDGVAIDAIATPEVAAAIAALAEKKIPVVTYYSDCPPVGTLGRSTFIGADLTFVGRMVASAMAEKIGPDGGLVAVISAPETPGQLALEKGITQFLDQPKFSVKGPERANVSEGGVQAAIDKVMAEENSVAGWILINPAAEPTGEGNPLAKLATSRAVLLSGTVAGMKVVDENKVVVAPPFAAMGQMVVRVLDAMVRNKTPFPETMSVDADVVTLSNMESMTETTKAIESGAKVVPVYPDRPKNDR
ncbi:MAG: substrate-binding domain-containing protein [Planctomycetes bacterium]|nr:substrate-binding domain-containing protein [Planctomycetota bacterium]